MATLSFGTADYIERLAVRLGARLECLLVLRCDAADADLRQQRTGEGARRLAPELHVGFVDRRRTAHRRRFRAPVLLSRRRDAADATRRASDWSVCRQARPIDKWQVVTAGNELQSADSKVDAQQLPRPFAAVPLVSFWHSTAAP